MHATEDYQWEVCNKTIFERYERDPRGSLHTYETLLKEENSLKIVIFCFNLLVDRLRHV